MGSAISKTAAGGEISVLDPGGFGAVTITKSITINGDGTLAGILHSATNGIIINAAGIKVNLRSLSLQGAGTTLGTNGIRILNASEVNIENCTIENVSGFGIEIAPTAVCGVTIKRTTIRGCAGGAVVAQPNAATGVAVNISKSSLNDSLFGFRAGDNVKAVLDDCVLAGNNNNGVTVNNSGGAATKVTVSRCTINDTGGFGVISSGATSTVFISNNVIFNNVTGVGTQTGGAMTSLGNNNIRGNTTDGAPLPPIVGQNEAPRVLHATLALDARCIGEARQAGPSSGRLPRLFSAERQGAWKRHPSDDP